MAGLWRRPPQPQRRLPKTIPAHPPGSAGTVTLVVADPANPTYGDRTLKNHAEGLGYVVTYVDDDAAADTSRQLVVVAESSGGATVGTKYRNVSIPVITFERAHVAAMDLATADATNGVAEGDDNVVILATGHTAVDGLSGTVQVVNPATRLDYNLTSELPAAAEPLYYKEDSATKIVAYCYEAGETMANAHVAEARRAFCGLAPDATLATLGGVGMRLIGALYEWALEAPSVNAQAGHAAGTGAAQAVATNIQPAAGQSVGTGTANEPDPTVAPTAGHASGSGSAFDATVSVSSDANAQAELASGTGTSNEPDPTIAPNAGYAAGTGAAQNSAPSIAVSAGTGGAVSVVSKTATTRIDYDVSPAVATMPAHSAGDLLVAIAACCGDFGTPADWNAVGDGWTEHDQAINLEHRNGIFSKVAQSSSETFSLTMTNPALTRNKSIHVWNFGPATVVAADVITDSSADTTYDVPALTGSATNGILLSGAQLAANRGITELTGTDDTLYDGTTGSGSDTNLRTMVDAFSGTDPASTTGSITNGSATSGGYRVLIAAVAVAPSGSGTAYGPKATVATTGGHSAGTGAVGQAVANVGPNAGHAVGTGSAFDATVKVEPSAIAAGPVGAAYQPSPSVAPNAGHASGSGSAFDATVSTAADTFAQAGHAAGTGAAYDASKTVSAGAGHAAGSVSGGTGGAFDGDDFDSEDFDSSDGLANPSTSVAPTAGHASGTGAANEPDPTVAPNAGHAAGTGAAFDATVTTTSDTDVFPDAALGTGAAQNPTLSVAPNAEHAPGAGAAFDADTSVSPTAGVAAGTGSAFNASINVQPNAGHASGAGTAQAPSPSVGPSASDAQGSGAANGASAIVAPNAGNAAGTGEAFQAAASTGTIEAQAGHAAGTGAAYDATIPVPVWTTPADGAPISDTTPELKFTMPDYGAPLFFELVLDTAATFNTGDLRVVRSSDDQTGWDFWNGGSWEPVPPTGVPDTYAGNEARYTVQTPLTGTTWYRRVRAGVAG